MSELRMVRLGSGDRTLARDLFAKMAEVFDEGAGPLSDTYLDRLLSRADFWAVAALLNGDVVGGLTAHTLPMTRSEAYEVFIFDVAVQGEYQRQGIGRQLIAALRAYAAAEGIHEVFVPADNDDVHALDFYQALGGVPAPVTIFTFSADTDD